jgi:hypothetical protein
MKYKITIKGAKQEKYLFLDIDGVMNSFDDYNMTGEEFLKKINDISFVISKKQINLLNEIVEKYNPKIVLSSYWRKRYPIQKINKIFKKNGFKGAVIAKTDEKGEEHKDRWNQIKRFIDKNSVESYIILDDDSLGNEAKNHIKTDSYIGIEKEHIDRIKKIWK